MNRTLLLRHPLTALALAASLVATAPVIAQVAGSTTTVDVSITESTQLATGWSVKKTLLGKTLYNEAGKAVGKVEDLIVTRDRAVSFVIVGAGGFIGIGRHDVAIPVTQIQDRAGRLVMAGATPELIKAMPVFTYTNDSARRDQLVAAAEKDIARGKSMVTALEKKSGAAVSEAKAAVDRQLGALQVDVKSAEDKLGEMKQATTARWKEFESGVAAATARLRKSMDSPAG
jgi:sporulation protein YlmC with PRC-barrel domain